MDHGRRLTAILVSDIVGYTKLMEEDTEGAVAASIEKIPG